MGKVIVFFPSENFSEDALTLHEHQVEIMRNYYEENSGIFRLVEKRENMWKKFLEFEVDNILHFRQIFILSQLFPDAINCNA